MPSRIVAIARSRAALAAVFLVAGLVAGPRVERFLSNLRVRVVKVSFEGPANKALAGKVYYPASLLRRPRHGVLFCHGTLPDGKDTAFYRALMKGLARRGYLVFGFDLRGFGKSPSISNIGRPVGLDFTADAKAAIAYMTEQLPVRRDTLTIMGHSLGAAIAFATGATDERVANIIAISAGNFLPRGSTARSTRGITSPRSSAPPVWISPPGSGTGWRARWRSSSTSRSRPARRC